MLKILIPILLYVSNAMAGTYTTNLQLYKPATGDTNYVVPFATSMNTLDSYVWGLYTSTYTYAQKDSTQTFTGSNTFNVTGAGVTTISSATILNATLGNAVVNGILSLSTSPFKVGGTTRDISTTGTQAITGLGFKPTAVIVFANIDGGFSFSMGAQGNNTPTGVVVENIAATTTMDARNNLIALWSGTGNLAYADVTSFDADGFTLTWSKSGSPTGTAYIKYAAFR